MSTFFLNTLLFVVQRNWLLRHPVYCGLYEAPITRAFAAWVAMGNPWLTHVPASRLSHPSRLIPSPLFFFLSLFSLFLSLVGLPFVASSLSASHRIQWRNSHRDGTREWSISRKKNFGSYSATSSHDCTIRKGSIKLRTMSLSCLFRPYLQQYEEYFQAMVWKFVGIFGTRLQVIKWFCIYVGQIACILLHYRTLEEENVRMFSKNSSKMRSMKTNDCHNWLIKSYLLIPKGAFRKLLDTLL